MDNQHKLIQGYRDLSEDEIALINRIKESGTVIGALVEMLEARPTSIWDQRWIDIGKTHLQQGFMALVRAVAKPEGF